MIPPMQRAGLALLVAGITGALAVAGGAWQDPPPPPQPGEQAPQRDPAAPQGVDALASGPVHEAFAEPVVFNPEPGPVVPKQPPDPIEEVPPDQKPEGENVAWVPGYWSWDEERDNFVWVSG